MLREVNKQWETITADVSRDLNYEIKYLHACVIGGISFRGFTPAASGTFAFVTF